MYKKHEHRKNPNVTTSPKLMQYRNFIKTNFPILKAKYPDLNQRDIIKMLAQMWKSREEAS